MSKSDAWFDEVYNANIQRMVRFVEAIFNDAEIAQDLAHEAFIVLISLRNRNVIIDRPGGFLMTTLRNIVGSEMQKAERKRVEHLAEWHEKYMTVEEQDKLEYYLPNWLSPEERQFLLWWLEEGRTMKEVGQLIGCSEHACYARMNRLRAKFKKKEKKSIFYA